LFYRQKRKIGTELETIRKMFGRPYQKTGATQWQINRPTKFNWIVDQGRNFLPGNPRHQNCFEREG
jgi:hypothetical protein